MDQQESSENTSRRDSDNASRRDFVKRAAYVVPAILTLAAAPAYAKAGSEKRCPPGQIGNDKSNSKKWKDC
jgi:hypothetical protein